ncbi:hypothetical protein ZIOFF_012430 [Zingiber officinale]|uniref:Uncharacterized protein n=1 Tax=Zingiber officinale TaxID=94328 RepID=A0A8J5M0E7_ZINOF|nr:hypothetical protein ZIOFF_012430 [Zingiber officinale]
MRSPGTGELVELPPSGEDDERDLGVAEDGELVRLLEEAISPLRKGYLPAGRVLYTPHLGLPPHHRSSSPSAPPDLSKETLRDKIRFRRRRRLSIHLGAVSGPWSQNWAMAVTGFWAPHDFHGTRSLFLPEKENDLIKSSLFFADKRLCSEELVDPSQKASMGPREELAWKRDISILSTGFPLCVPVTSCVRFLFLRARSEAKADFVRPQRPSLPASQAHNEILPEMNQQELTLTSETILSSEFELGNTVGATKGLPKYATVVPLPVGTSTAAPWPQQTKSNKEMGEEACNAMHAYECERSDRGESGLEFNGAEMNASVGWRWGASYDALDRHRGVTATGRQRIPEAVAS